MSAAASGKIKMTAAQFNRQAKKGRANQSNTMVSETESTISGTTTVGGFKHRGNIRLENTYQLEPKPGTKFGVTKTKECIESVLHSYLDDQTYDHAKCGELARDLSQLIKDRVKELNFPRYKLITTLTIGQDANQGVAIGSRCTWDTKTDNCAVVNYTNGNMFATAAVFGVYLE